jgi:ABC-type bacteriocin/lantibiotic exporter with double-glycine peptidase domain
VALAAFALVPYNLLLLDEASNHLDAGTLHALTDALKVGPNHALNLPPQGLMPQGRPGS